MEAVLSILAMNRQRMLSLSCVAISQCHWGKQSPLFPAHPPLAHWWGCLVTHKHTHSTTASSPKRL